MSLLNIAHRGASADAPENTSKAFELAIKQGADMIETDLRLSRDGEIPLYHDDLPTLEDALDRFGHRIPFNLELKRGATADYPGLEERVLREITRRDLLGRTLFSAFYDTALATLRGLSSQARIGLLISRKAPIRIVERAIQLRAEAVHPERVVTTRELVEEMHEQGLRVHVFTVDDPGDQRRLIEWGVDGIFTNVPAWHERSLSKRSPGDILPLGVQHPTVLSGSPPGILNVRGGF